MDNHVRVLPQGATYHAYIGVDFGSDNPDWFFLDARGLAWDEARALVLGRLSRWLNDDCPTCRRKGTEAHRLLTALEPGAEFEASVEGDDYLIVREPALGMAFHAPTGTVAENWPADGWVHIGSTTDSPGMRH